MENEAFGTYARSPQSGLSHLEEDTPYTAFIKTCRPARDDKGEIKTNQDGKTLARVTFVLDENTSLNRTYSVSFGQNNANKQWAAWALFLEAACGISCGEPSQRKLKPSDIEGQTVKIYIEHTAEGYTNVVKVKPPGRKVPDERPGWPEANPFDKVAAVKKQAVPPADIPEFDEVDDKQFLFRLDRILWDPEDEMSEVIDIAPLIFCIVLLGIVVWAVFK